MPYKDKQMQKEYQKKYQKNMPWYFRQKEEAKLGTTSFKSQLCRKKDGTPDWVKEQEEINKEKTKTIYGRYKQYGSRRKYLKHTLYNYQ